MSDPLNFQDALWQYDSGRPTQLMNFINESRVIDHVHMHELMKIICPVFSARFTYRENTLPLFSKALAKSQPPSFYLHNVDGFCTKVLKENQQDFREFITLYHAHSKHLPNAAIHWNRHLLGYDSNSEDQNLSPHNKLLTKVWDFLTSIDLSSNQKGNLLVNWIENNNATIAYSDTVQKELSKWIPATRGENFFVNFLAQLCNEKLDNQAFRDRFGSTIGFSGDYIKNRWEDVKETGIFPEVKQYLECRQLTDKLHESLPMTTTKLPKIKI